MFSLSNSCNKIDYRKVTNRTPKYLQPNQMCVYWELTPTPSQLFNRNDLQANYKLLYWLAKEETGNWQELVEWIPSMSKKNLMRLLMHSKEHDAIRQQWTKMNQGDNISHGAHVDCHCSLGKTVCTQNEQTELYGKWLLFFNHCRLNGS